MDLAGEAMSRFDIDAAVAHLSAAIREYTAAGEPCAAAMASVQLGDLMANAMGNLTAARAWFARAERLVADQPPCLEQGWVAVAAMGCDVDDPAVLLSRAELALDRARRFGDVNLETKALADAGLAHVQAGRLAEGMALLDEAMALACGPADDVDTTAKSVCSFFTACYHAADFGRAATWADLLRRHGLISPEPGGPVFLSSHCDSVQAAALIELGEWDEAERVLLRAKESFETAMGGLVPAWHPDTALADLRIRQGRLAEAEELLIGKDQSMQALLPMLRLHLTRGDVDLARAAAQRGLRAVKDDRLRAIKLLTSLVEVELAVGDVDAAVAACDALAERLAGVTVPSLLGRAAVARARVDLARGDAIGAALDLERALDELDLTRLPLVRRSIETALAAARAPRQADVDGRGRPAVLRRDGKLWTASAGEVTVRLPDTKGLRYVAELVARPGAEQHALDLVDRVEGVGDVDRRSLGDAGPAADATTRDTFRRRIEQLRAEVDDAIAIGALETAEAKEREIETLVRELAAAFGLGGRDRKAVSAAERARLNVTRAIRAAVGKLEEALPDAGAALDRHVRTGTYCAYVPAPGEIRWIVQS